MNGTNDFHLPSAKLKLFQKGVFYSGSKTYNHLPKTIKELSHDMKQFRLVLKRFILSNSFYPFKSILTLTGNEWCFVILILVKWHVGFKFEIFLYFNMYEVSLLYITHTDTNFTCIFCMLLFFSCTIIDMTVSVSCKSSTENHWMDEWVYKLGRSQILTSWAKYNTLIWPSWPGCQFWSSYFICIHVDDEDS
jgi:hypothetical protein